MDKRCSSNTVTHWLHYNSKKQQLFPIIIIIILFVRIPRYKSIIIIIIVRPKNGREHSLCMQHVQTLELYNSERIFWYNIVYTVPVNAVTVAHICLGGPHSLRAHIMYVYNIIILLCFLWEEERTWKEKKFKHERARTHALGAHVFTIFSCNVMQWRYPSHVLSVVGTVMGSSSAAAADFDDEWVGGVCVRAVCAVRPVVVAVVRTVGQCCVCVRVNIIVFYFVSSSLSSPPLFAFLVRTNGARVLSRSANLLVTLDN